MKKIIGLFLILLLFTGCSIVRIDTSSIDNILNIILTKDNTLFNQVGQGYKYYLPSDVLYIESDGLNDVLYSNGTYYYLYVDAISYYYKVENDYAINKDAYYSKVFKKEDNFKGNGYLEITEENDMYYLNFIYNYAKIEAVVKKDELNNAVLNASYILSTIKYNEDIVRLMLEEDYFTNKTGKLKDYDNTSTNTSEKFVLEKDNELKEG